MMGSPPVSAIATPVATGGQRNHGLDALRAALTLLVIFHHSALTYGAIGGWYYREVPTDGRTETKLLILFCTVNQAWFMGLFFLIAGYFTPGAVERHGAIQYLRERLIRLGLPLLLYGFVIGPVTIALASTARGKPFRDTLVQLWEHGRFDNGPLWFAQALLNFAVLYVLWRGAAPRRVTMKARRFPTNAAMTLAMMATGGAAFLLRLLWPVGSSQIGLQLAYFASYVVLFAAGCLGAQGRWLDAVPSVQVRRWAVIALCALPVFPAIVLLSGSVPSLRGNSSGGWNIQALIYAFWEPLVAWGTILTLLTMFSVRYRRMGFAGLQLSRRAYAMYVIHPPVLVSVALLWRTTDAPHLVKFFVTGAMACALCYLVAGGILRMSWLRRVL